MNPIFISYRREDSADVTGRINDHLRARFGQAAVFIDVDNIPFGLDFREHLEAQVSQCDVLLAVIGRDWLSAATEEGRSRLDDPSDYVRAEIESALRRGIPVVPLLVQGAEMPPESELPESIRGLSFRNGIPIRRDPDFQNDIARLTSWLEEHVQGGGAGARAGGDVREPSADMSPAGVPPADSRPEIEIATYLWTLSGLIVIGVTASGLVVDLDWATFLLTLGVPITVGVAFVCFALARRAADPLRAATTVFLGVSAAILAGLVVGAVAKYQEAWSCYVIASSVSLTFLASYVVLLLGQRRAAPWVFPAARLLAVTQALVFATHAAARIIVDFTDSTCEVDDEVFLYLLYFTTHASGLIVTVAFLVVSARFSSR